MILFDPAEGGAVGGGEVSTPAVAAPASTPVEAAIPAGTTEDSLAGVIRPKEAPAADKPAAPVETPKFRPVVLEWAKEAGFTDEDLKDYGSEKALIRALKPSVAQEQAIQEPVKPVVQKQEEPKAPVKQEVTSEQIDAIKIPDFDGDEKLPIEEQVHPRIREAFSALKKFVLNMHTERTQERQEAQRSSREPINKAIDDYFEGQKDFVDLFGSNKDLKTDSPQWTERMKVVGLAMQLLGKQQPTPQLMTKLMERAQFATYMERMTGAVKAEAKKEVAIANRQTQFISKSRPARAVVVDEKNPGPTDAEIQENIRKSLKK